VPSLVPPLSEPDDSSGPDAEALHGRVQGAVIHFIARVVLYNHLVAQHVGLGASDGQFMTLLDVYGPLTPGELARHTGMTTGTVTGVLDRLERVGFVERTRDTKDRRKVVVTRREEVLAEKLFPYYAPQAHALAEVLSTRSPEELRVIAEFLEDMTARDDPDLTET
jgi:DNA-binding MarR family transcriptional regulator